MLLTSFFSNGVMQIIRIFLLVARTVWLKLYNKYIRQDELFERDSAFGIGILFDA
jgi:hypothetical protein